MKYKLKYSIKVPATPDKAEYEITELNLVDRMQVQHAEKIPDEAFHGEGVNPTRFIPAIAVMADLDLSIIKRLDFVDLVSIMEGIVTPFLSDMGLADSKQKK